MVAMQSRWCLSQFYTDTTGMVRPIVADYGGNYLVPTHPTVLTDWALVLVNMDSNQLHAAAQDTRVVVCPFIFNPSNVPASVTAAYSTWAGVTATMSLGALLSALAETEPIFGTQTL